MSYREQFIWQRSVDLAVKCYELTQRFPQSELYGLTSRPLAKVVAEVLWGLNKGDRSPVFLRSSGLIHKKT
jgi:hypothetical protein